MRNGSTATKANDWIPLLTIGTAVIAAILLVGVWAPTQIRELDAALRDATADRSDAWTRIPFVTSEGTTSSIAATNGRVRILTMMYTHCPGSCPLAVATLQRIEGGLSPQERSRLGVIALSLDPAQDTPAALREFRRARGIDTPRWMVARPAATDLPSLAHALGVNYQSLGDGFVDHESVFILLDKSGRVLWRTHRTQNEDPRFTTALRQAIAAN
ncbi:MAG TPA: SCO family protein [Steroidobacteraceae bacterium]|nr:SCO family protein [Steroidobacteraceae bacterium]